MQTVTISTSQNIDIEYEVASLGDRVLARLTDMAIFILIMLMGIGIIALNTGLHALDESLMVILIGLYFVLYVFYDLLCEIFMGGQSVGKRLMKIKVVSLGGERPTLSQYLLRWLFRIVDFTLSSALCALIMVAVTDKRQRLGDMVAGTTLIKTQPRTKAEHIAFIPEVEEYEPVYPQVTALTDRDIELIHEVITTYMQTGNTSVVYTMAQRVKDHLNVTPPENENSLQFLQGIVKDYNNLVSK